MMIVMYRGASMLLSIIATTNAAHSKTVPMVCREGLTAGAFGSRE
ncbi:hypothetical protein [Streptomyces sp. MJP52]|nr:hypothetical protein [Streptomyces sp. MJP52]MDH6229404.1 hypothetical protein [Streptomyces sp. MJP52]